jgi:decaprenylphospho-beta-D-erythro-pentofuranosid-2-ulose 2-reductase
VKTATGRIDRVLVLGGNSDIGVTTAEALVRGRGARHVILAARRPDALGDRTATLSAAGAKVDTVAFDALDFDGHDTFVADVFDRFGDIDVVVLAFGILGDQARSEADAAHARDVVQTNFTGAVSVLVPLAQRLRQQGHGAVVVLSTIAAVAARRTNFTYGASKAGLDAFALGLGDALADSGARVLVVRPGFVRTQMTEGMEEAPFSTDARGVAERVLAALDAPGTNVTYAPAPVRGIGWVLRSLPRPVLRKLPR